MTTAPQRIVSLYPAATEMVCAIGLGERLVGVSHECNWPPEIASLPRLTRSCVDSSAGSAAIDAQVKALAAAGAPLYELDAERLAELRPELILAQAQCDVCAVSFDAVVGAVAASPVLERAAVLALNPTSLADVLVDVERIGVAAGAAVQTRSYVAELQRRIDVVRQSASRSVAPPPSVVVIEWIAPLMIAGNWTPELVETAGGAYELARAGEHSCYVSWPSVREYSPQVIVVAPCGFDLARSRREAKELESLPGWEQLPAVRNGQVHVVDGDAYFNRPGPRLVDSLEWLGSILRR